jgi:hypothetical protein
MEMQTSEEINELAAALAIANAQIGPLSLDKEAKIPSRTGSGFSYKYTSLANLIATIKKPLSDNGLSILNFPSAKGNEVKVTTLLLHKSGQFISGDFTMTSKTSDPKDVGSVISYARRYAETAILNLAGEEDFDGLAISEVYTGTSEQKVWLFDVLGQAGIDKSDMGGFHSKMIANKLTVNEHSIFSLIDQGRN